MRKNVQILDQLRRANDGHILVHVSYTDVSGPQQTTLDVTALNLVSPAGITTLNTLYAALQASVVGLMNNMLPQSTFNPTDVAGAAAIPVNGATLSIDTTESAVAASSLKVATAGQVSGEGAAVSLPTTELALTYTAQCQVLVPASSTIQVRLVDTANNTQSTWASVTGTGAFQPVSVTLNETLSQPPALVLQLVTNRAEMVTFNVDAIQLLDA